MVLEPGRAGLVVLGLNGVEVCRQRGLGVHHDVLRARQADQHVGPQAALLGVGALLLVEIAVVQHAGHLDHPAKLNLTQRPHLRTAKGLDEVGRLALKLPLRFHQRLHLLGQAAIGRPGPFPTR